VPSSVRMVTGGRRSSACSTGLSSVEGMVDLGKLDRLGAVRIPVVADSSVGGPRPEASPRSFLRYEGVVEVGEDRLESFEGAPLSLLGGVVVRVTMRGALGLARWNADLVAPPHHLYVADVWPMATGPALLAQTSGVSGGLTQHNLWT
jgi:hypothetical protein